MKKLTFLVLGVQTFPENARGNVAALIIKPSAQLLKKDGTQAGSIELNPREFVRVVTRCVGMFNPIGFKHIVEACNGSAKLSIDSLECKEGEPYLRSDASTGTYTKTWIKNSNYTVSLGIIGSMKLAEMSFAASFAEAANQYAQVPTSSKPKVKVEANNDTPDTGADESHDGEESSDTPKI